LVISLISIAICSTDRYLDEWDDDEDDEKEDETSKKELVQEADEERLCAEDTELIPLSKFCYAILTNQVLIRCLIYKRIS